jgi:hypothetical protein
MVVTDFDGKPLAKMVPIATLNPNAFDPPIASGAPTDAQGRSVLMLPPSTRLFLRAWDPELHMFPNNFYEVPAAPGTYTPQTRVTMIPASALEAVLEDSTGHAVGNAEADLMLIHPKQGPWWPAKAHTDERGAVRFAPVPPGEYVIEIAAQGVGKGRVPLTFLPPTRMADVGKVRLSP